MHHGSCLCGSIRYAIDDDLKRVVNCHCRFCSKAHGAPFVTLLFMPFAKLQLTTGRDLLRCYEVQATKAMRCFCSRCGTRLYNESPAHGMISLIVSTLDTPAELQPLAHINTESKRSWVPIHDQLPTFRSVPSQSEFAQLFSGEARRAID